MKSISLLLLMGLSSMALSQEAKIPFTISHAEGFAIEIRKLPIKDSLHFFYNVYFRVPEMSDEVLVSREINCKGWMPEDAKIKEIKIFSINGLPFNSQWECSVENCSWSGGSTGYIKLKIPMKEIQMNSNFSVDIKGLGSYFGIEKWYDCVLILKYEDSSE